MTSIGGNLRAGRWAARTAREARRQLRARSLLDVRVPAPPALPKSALLGVRLGLRTAHASCLERSLVLQRWHADHGNHVDVIIGVRGPTEFGAHAWLEYESPPAEQGFRELLRLASP